MGTSENKRKRRQERHERNKLEQEAYKKEAWESGKFIEENHNGFGYSSAYTFIVSKRLVKCILQEYEKSQSSSTKPKEVACIEGFRKYRIIIRDCIIFWSPEYSEDCPEYEFLKGLLECYWDRVLGDKDEGALQEYIKPFYEKWSMMIF